LIVDALKAQPLVIVDDVHLLDLLQWLPLLSALRLFQFHHDGPLHLCAAGQKETDFRHQVDFAEAAAQRSYSFGIERFKVEDYAALVEAFHGDVKRMDFEKIFRFAPKLNAHQLQAACQWLVNYKELTTDLFIDTLDRSALPATLIWVKSKSWI